MNYYDRAIMHYFGLRGLYGDRRQGPVERYMAWDDSLQMVMRSHHDWKRRKYLLTDGYPSWVEDGIASILQ